MFTTDTFEGVETPLTEPPPLLEDEPPLQPASSRINAASPKPSVVIFEIDVMVFMVFSLKSVYLMVARRLRLLDYRINLFLKEYEVNKNIGRKNGNRSA